MHIKSRDKDSLEVDGILLHYIRTKIFVRLFFVSCFHFQIKMLFQTVNI